MTETTNFQVFEVPAEIVDWAADQVSLFIDLTGITNEAELYRIFVDAISERMGVR
jgi:hypothetical protein